MGKRWRAIFRHNHRFKVTLTSWAALHGFFFRNRIGIGFTAMIRNKTKLLFRNNLSVGFASQLYRIGKVVFGTKIGISTKMKLFLKGKLSGFVEFTAHIM